MVAREMDITTQLEDALYNIRTSVEPSVFVEGYDETPKNIMNLSDYAADYLLNGVGKEITDKLTRTFMQYLGDLKDSVFSYKYCTGHTQQTILDKVSESGDTILQAIQHINFTTPAIVLGLGFMIAAYIFKR